MAAISEISRCPVVIHDCQKPGPFFLANASTSMGHGCVKIDAIAFSHDVSLPLIDELVPTLQDKKKFFALMLEDGLFTKSWFDDLRLHALAQFFGSEGSIFIPV